MQSATGVVFLSPLTAHKPDFINHVGAMVIDIKSDAIRRLLSSHNAFATIVQLPRCCKWTSSNYGRDLECRHHLGNHLKLITLPQDTRPDLRPDAPVVDLMDLKSGVLGPCCFSAFNFHHDCRLCIELMVLPVSVESLADMVMSQVLYVIANRGLWVIWLYIESHSWLLKSKPHLALSQYLRFTLMTAPSHTSPLPVNTSLNGCIDH